MAAYDVEAERNVGLGSRGAVCSLVHLVETKKKVLGSIQTPVRYAFVLVCDMCSATVAGGSTSTTSTSEQQP